MITISTDSAAALEAYRVESGLPFMMLSDSEKKLIKEYDLFNESEHDGVAVPAIIVVDHTGTVRYSHVQGRYIRIRNKKLLKDLESLGLN